MIIGLGEDLVEIARIAQIIAEKGDRFLQKCFTKEEIARAANHKTRERRDAYYAKRYAAKEACLKALGTGMRQGLSWHDMQTSNDALGRPVMSVSGGVAETLHKLVSDGATAKIHVTLSDESGLAKATVILEAILDKP